MDIKVIQIVTEQWTNRDGKINTEIVGLADDGLVYRWHKSTGKWVLLVIQN